MDYENTRIAKLRQYLINIIDELTSNNKYQINADMLSNKIGDYSLNKIPTRTAIETWIIGPEIHRDVFAFRSRKAYSQDVINNLTNIGFFEEFERIIKFNDDNNILPDIENIESISCLNCGTLINAETQTAIFDIQIQITYRETQSDSIISM